MHKNYLLTGAVFACLAVILGAFGAHGLQNSTSDENILHGYQTAVQYQMYHSLALLLTGILSEKFPGNLLKWSGRCFGAGILLFSGSLYGLTFLKLNESNAVKIVGPLTPVGGLCFIAGWVLLLVAVLKKR